MPLSDAVSVSIKPFRRVLVANRGEIAVRIIRALRELSIQSVALYSHPDRHGMHVNLADYAVRMGGDGGLDSTYLNHRKVVQAAVLSGCDGIHPGYGFLSENHEFVALVEQTEGIRFIGPSSQAMAVLSDKLKAKEIFKSQGVPVLEGSSSPIPSVDALKSVAEKIGYPLVLKAAAGGGGRGMRVVYCESDLECCFAEAIREAEHCFGVKDVFCETYLSRPRHIEFQTVFDGYGAGVHLFERDCSLQRRYQKILEEAPAVGMSAEQRDQMGSLAVAAGIRAGYCGVATVEYICDGDEFYFMEMNTRIQVEHPVTEMITGVDLVKESIKMAEGRALSYAQADLSMKGHAIEVRINAEDPSSHFAPCFGTVGQLRFPSGPSVRVDSHLVVGYDVPDQFDSLLAKIIVWGSDREEAIARMTRALRELKISPIKTTQAFFEALLHHEGFRSGDVFTTFIAHHKDQLIQMIKDGFKENHKEPLPNTLQTSDFEHHVIAATLAQDHQQKNQPQPLSEGTLWHRQSIWESTHT